MTAKTEITLYINPNPNWDVAPTAAELEAVRADAEKRVKDMYPSADVTAEVKDSLRSFSVWSEDGSDMDWGDEQRLTWAINEAWDHVFCAA